MNKKVIFACVIVVAVVTAGYWLYLSRTNQGAPVDELSPEEKQLTELATGCENTGGVVIPAMCCLSAGNFPNECVIGACGCSPENSHEVKKCDCPPGKCFDGTACVNF